MQAPAINQLRTAFDAPFVALGHDAGADADAVVLGWPSVPVEVIRAVGLRPVLARSSTQPTPVADAELEPGVFPGRLRQLFEAALTGRLAHVAAIIVPRTSDPDYKCFLYLREFARRGIGGPFPPVLLFDLLQSAGQLVAWHDHGRVQELFTQLAGLRGTRADPDELRAAIHRANCARAAGRKLQALRQRMPRLAGADALPLIGSIWQVPADAYVQLASDAAIALAAGRPRAGARVLLAGAPVDSPALHAHIESHGATVVDEVSPFGSDAIWGDIPEDADPATAIASHYRSDPATARTPVATAMGRVDSALAQVDAVVVNLPPEDATCGWDYPRLRSVLERRGIPHAVFTADPAGPLPVQQQRALRRLFEGILPNPAVRHG